MQILSEEAAMKKDFKKRGIFLLSVTGVFLLLITLLMIFQKEKLANDNGNHNGNHNGNDNSTDNSAATITEKLVDYEALGISEYEYPSEFSMGDNLKAAIIELALRVGNCNQESVNSWWWKEMFVDCFIQNSRMSFDYLRKVSDRNDGWIAVDELNYMHASLMGVELDFSSYGSVNSNDDASGMNGGWINEWDYEYTVDGVIVTADLEVATDGIGWTQQCEITANLVRNPYSCFDGYSVASLSLKVIPTRFKPGEHVFYGIDSGDETDGVFTFEFSYCEDDVHYGHFVYLDLTASPELADFVRKNAGSTFKVTYILGMEETADPIEDVVPIDIVLDDREH